MGIKLHLPSQHDGQYNKEPLWRKPCHTQTNIEPHYVSWLLDNSSLTKKLIEKSRGDFRIDVLQQSVRAVSFCERKALQMPQRQWAVIREVVLCGNDVPWVYARTVIPLSTLRGSLRRLYYLGNQSLGEQLFTDTSMFREPVEIALLSAHYFSQTVLKQLQQTIPVVTSTWGRRSVFRLSDKPLLVSEIFLPALFNVPLIKAPQ